jgi:hypothetical protein
VSAYRIGDRVAHAQYGDGTVTRANEYHTAIEFDAHGSRTFVSERIVLTSSEVPAPVKSVKRRRAAAATAATAAAAK